MKKLLMSLLFISALLLASCSASDSDTHVYINSHQWKHAHINVGDGTVKHYNLSNVRETTYGAVYFTLSDGTEIKLNTNYIMYDADNCPLCGEVNYL